MRKRDKTDTESQLLNRKLREKDEELRRLQAKYERSEQALASVQNILPELPIPFAVISENRTVSFVNRELESLVGGGDLEDQPYSVALFGEEERDARCPIHRALASGNTEKGVGEAIGQSFLDCIARPIRLPDGRRAVAAVFPESRASALRENELHLEKLSALGELISGIAHELNNPLTGVIGFSELLAQRELDEKTGEMIQRVLNEANRCRKIVANLLSFSRKRPYKRAPVYIDCLIGEAIELLRYELRASNINVAHHIGSKLPATMGDPYLLQEVFFNIIHNALQAMSAEPGGGTLTISSFCEADTINVSIGDTGPGIPEELVDKIFDPFFTTKSADRGTGLGLSISHKIINKHGGTLTVVSAPGSGATFHMTLPVRALPKQKVEPTGAARVGTDFKSGNILIIDDEQPILDLLSEILENKQHNVTTTQKASEALRVMSDQRYDCIISDIKMPELDGREFYELVRALRPEMLKRLIFITGDYLSDSTANFVREVSIPYLKKPFSPEEILDVTNRVLRSSSAS